MFFLCTKLKCMLGSANTTTAQKVRLKERGTEDRPSPPTKKPLRLRAFWMPCHLSNRKPSEGSKLLGVLCEYRLVRKSSSFLGHREWGNHAKENNRSQGQALVAWLWDSKGRLFVDLGFKPFPRQNIVPTGPTSPSTATARTRGIPPMTRSSDPQGLGSRTAPRRRCPIRASFSGPRLARATQQWLTCWEPPVKPECLQQINLKETALPFVGIDSNTSEQGNESCHGRIRTITKKVESSWS